MGFFASFNQWLTALLATYIGENTQLIAATLEPAIIALGVLYVMVWGWLLLTGQIEEPVLHGVQRIFALGGVIALAIHLWLFNAVIVETFFRAPADLAQVIIGNYDGTGVIDGIANNGADVASALLTKAGVLSGEGWSYLVAAFLVYIVIWVLAIYVGFLFALSQVALSVLLALGPLFLVMLLFRSTHRLFASWLSQLVNYALIGVLAVLVASLMLHVIETATQQAMDAGGAITIAHAARVCMAGGLTLLIIRQVMPMAASIASGVSLVSFGIFSGTSLWVSSVMTRAVGRRGQAIPQSSLSASRRNTLRMTRRQTA